MAVLEDDLGSEQTLEKILEQTNTLWENGSGTKDKITLPGNHTHRRIQIHTIHVESMEVNCVM